MKKKKIYFVSEFDDFFEKLGILWNASKKNFLNRF